MIYIINRILIKHFSALGVLVSTDNLDRDSTVSVTILARGTKVHHYEIVRRLGAGGMGEVYLAEDTKLKRQVALKFLSPELSEDQAYRDRFIQEAQAAARINHPNVVTVHETNQFAERIYIAMEYISGKSLEDHIKENKLNFSKKLEIARQICDGLKAAHDCGLIHRDLKPGNIMITVSGRVIILDFGLARMMHTDSVDEAGRIEGTVHYMSPEQVSGSKLSCSTDIFSLGTVLYELVTGKMPFTGADMNRVMYSILHETPVPPIEIRPDLPEWMNAMILKLLDKEPMARFADADSLLDYMNGVLEKGESQGKITDYKTRKKAVTVIHLKNLSGDQSWDYFCEGFTEDMIREISRRTDLIVGAEPASKSDYNIAEVFQRCRSDYVITGSLMHWKNKIRMGLCIYSEDGDKILLGENFEGVSDDLFTIMGNAACQTAEVLAKASGSAAHEAVHAVAADVTAYDYYLKGRNYYHTNKPEDLGFAAKMFEKSLEVDPGFALAHTGLADVHISRYMAYYDHNPKQLELARLEAEKALNMNPQLPEAHRSLGRYYMFSGDLKNANKTLLKCIDIDPRYAIGYRTIAWLKDWQGDFEDALDWAKRALELAPTDLETLLLISLLYLELKKYTLAMATLQRAIELGPDYGRAYFMLGQVYKKLGAIELALENYLSAIKFEGDINSYVEAGYCCILLEKYSEANQRFNDSISRGFLPFIAHYYKGLIRLLQGHRGEASDLFERVIEGADRYYASDPQNDVFLGYKILALALLGRKDEASAHVEECRSICSHQGEGLYIMARIYAVLGDKKEMEHYRELAINEFAGPTRKELNLDPHFRHTF
jgi:serine/threonine protein kinase/tetratricopeptide (TPR) repeat protein